MRAIEHLVTRCPRPSRSHSARDRPDDLMAAPCRPAPSARTMLLKETSGTKLHGVSVHRPGDVDRPARICARRHDAIARPLSFAVTPWCSCRPKPRPTPACRSAACGRASRRRLDGAIQVRVEIDPRRITSIDCTSVASARRRTNAIAGRKTPPATRLIPSGGPPVARHGRRARAGASASPHRRRRHH